MLSKRWSINLQHSNIFSTKKLKNTVIQSPTCQAGRVFYCGIILECQCKSMGWGFSSSITMSFSFSLVNQWPSCCFLSKWHRKIYILLGKCSTSSYSHFHLLFQLSTTSHNVFLRLFKLFAMTYSKASLSSGPRCSPPSSLSEAEGFCGACRLNAFFSTSATCSKNLWCSSWNFQSW